MRKESLFEPTVDGSVGTHPCLPLPTDPLHSCREGFTLLWFASRETSSPQHSLVSAWVLLVFFGNLYIVPKFSRFLECQNGMKHLCICPDRGELPTAPHPALSWLLGEHKSTKSKLLLSEDDDG